jgi:nucleoside-diphosphate-sugar epimerase
MADRILVTGGAGYIGCVLVPRLLGAGYRVRVLDKLVFGAAGLERVRDRIELVAGDIRSLDPTVFAGVTSVVHLAGLSNDPTAEFNPAANMAINTQGTLSLAEQCKQAGIERFVFASSCSLYYTPEPDETLHTETQPIDPKAPYARSKYEAELGLNKLADDSFCPVSLRQGTVFGPSPRSRYDLVVNTFTKDAYTQRRLTVHAGGRMWRPMLHIDDACDAYIEALVAPAAAVGGRAYNVFSGNFQVLNIAHEIRRILEHKHNIRLELDVQQVGSARSYRADGVAFEKTFGRPLNRGLDEAVEGLWCELEQGTDPEDAIHYNIRWLELLTDMNQRLSDMGGTPL